MRLPVSMLFIFFFSPGYSQDGLHIIFRQDFEHNTTGIYNREEWKQDWNHPPYENNLKNTYIVKQDNGNHVMKWIFPAGSVGPGQGGGQFEAPLVKGLNEVYFSYNIQFRPGFEWVLGGKLPGLAGGPHSYWPGVRKPAWQDGFSNGLMWGYKTSTRDRSGHLYFYSYYQDMYGLYGDLFPWGNFSFQTDTGRWYNITIRMVMNTIKPDGSGGNFDGIMEGFIDGVLMVSKTGLRFRNTNTVHIDRMKIYSHFGGSGPEYGALRDEWILLDDVYLFNYAGSENVPKGNVPSKPGRILELPAMKSSSLRSKERTEVAVILQSLNLLQKTDTSFRLAWSRSGAKDIRRFSITIDGQPEITTNDTSMYVSGLTAATSYSVKFACVSDSGVEFRESRKLTITTTGKDKSPPSIPAGIKVKNVTMHEINLSWQASTDNLGVAGYRISVNGVGRSTSPVPFYMIKGLIPDTEYEIHITSYDTASNESEPSAAVKVRTEGPDTEPPAVPENLKVTSKGDKSALLTWDPSEDNRGVAGYVVFVDGIFRGTTTGTSYVIKGVTPGKKYTFSVSAFDERSNKSASADPVSFTPSE